MSGAGGHSRRPSPVAPDGPASHAASGAWAKPLAARKFHYFRDGLTISLCGAYMTAQVKPSQFGSGEPVEERCPTCERKLSYWTVEA